MKNKNTIIAFGVLFLMVILSRWVSHLWNFTLVGGAFLFAGSYFKDKKIALALMLSSMLVSDYVIGFHNQMMSVYLSYALVILIGTLLTQAANRFKILGFSFIGSLVFFIITNFSVWYEGQMYPMTLSGLIDCYVMGLPFYRNQLISDLASAILFFEVARQFLVTKTESAKV